MGGGKVVIRKKSTKRAGRSGTRRRHDAIAEAFDRLGNRSGSAVVLAVGEGGTDRDVAQSILVFPATSAAEGRAESGTATRLLGKAQNTKKLARALAAAGHPDRLAILGKLLDGPAVYRFLQHATRLKVGPLYHHINQLRLAGLIMPKQRDLYELTRGGRNLILAVAALGRMIEDNRRRPV